jgi:glycerol-3-phosphate acyltransferase PlsY
VTAGAAVEVALVALAGFLVGSVNPAALLARARGSDLRSSGSGNPGATNAGRVLGRKWGVLVLVLDVLKAFVPTWVTLWWLGLVPALVAGFAVVLGHVFSPFLRGRGGKGVACALGAILAVAPWVAVGAVVVFGVAMVLVSYIGEASVVVTGALLLLGLLSGAGLVPFVEPAVGWWLVAVSLLVLSRHRRNIRYWWERRHP